MIISILNHIGKGETGLPTSESVDYKIYFYEFIGKDNYQEKNPTMAIVQKDSGDLNFTRYDCHYNVSQTLSNSYIRNTN